MQDNDEAVEGLLRANALRLQDAAFTQRVLEALPRRSRSRISGRTQRSFAVATRAGSVLVLIAVAQLWYIEGPGGVDALIAILMVLAPASAAISRVCGPLIPRSALRQLWRGGRHWH